MYLFDLYFHVMYLNNSSEYMKKHCLNLELKYSHIELDLWMEDSCVLLEPVGRQDYILSGYY
jgi:hypothetical protein